MQRVTSNLPPGINYEVLRRWLEMLEQGAAHGQSGAGARRLGSLGDAEVLPARGLAHVVDVPGTTIEELLKRERLARDTGPADG